MSSEERTEGHSCAMAQFRLQNVEDFYEIGDLLGRYVQINYFNLISFPNVSNNVERLM